MPYLACSQIWLNLPTDDSHLGYNSKLTQKIIDPHVSSCSLISPSALLKRSARAHIAGNAWLIEPWMNWPGWIDPHIGITVKIPKPIHVAILGPQNYRFGIWDPDLVLGNDIYNYLNIYEKNLNGLCGVNLPWSGWTWPILEGLWKSQSFCGQLQNTIDVCSGLRQNQGLRIYNPKP
jgi:hypothetical protein